MFALSDIKHVVRYSVGNDNPEKSFDEKQTEEQLAKLNFALGHGGKIVGQEKNFYLLNIGEHQTVLQFIVYQVGFERKPYWLGKTNKTQGE